MYFTDVRLGPFTRIEMLGIKGGLPEVIPHPWSIGARFVFIPVTL